MANKIIEYVDLHSQEGGSDKCYHCAIQEVEGGFIVPFAYGRVGSTLNTGCKTSAPVFLEVARKEYEKLVRSKTGKGYVSSPGISGNVFGVGLSGDVPSPTATVATKTFTDHRPQLLNPITENEVAYYINNPLWGAQEKKDGERRAVRSTVANGIEGINKKGQVVPLHPELVADVNGGGRCFLIDGESIGKTLYAFDLLDLDSGDQRHLPYLERYNRLLALDEHHNFDCVYVVPLAITKAEKQALFDRVKAEGGEGVVFKRLDATYSEGRPASGGDQVKYKFIESATCIVTALNTGKRSVQIAGIELAGHEVPIGNVTIPPNRNIPAVGSLVEVSYLYYYPSGSLYQPQYQGERSDADRTDCDVAKLKVVQELRKAA